MLLFDISDKQLKVLDLSPKIFGGEEISSYVKASLKEGLVVNRIISDAKQLAQEIKSILQKEGLKLTRETDCALSLHDERVFTLRLKVAGGKDVARQIDAQIETFLPERSSERIVSYKDIGADKDGEVQFVAADKNLFSGYVDLFKALEVNLVLADPESYAVYWVLKPQIKEGETIIYLNAESQVVDAVVMDRWGVLQTFTAAGESPDPEKKIKEIMDFMKSRWLRTIGKVLIGGEGDLNAAELGKKLNMPVERADKVLTSYPFPFGSKTAGINRLEILHLLGLALLARQKDVPNLAHAV